jgi:hypothetical protein
LATVCMESADPDGMRKKMMEPSLTRGPRETVTQGTGRAISEIQRESERGHVRVGLGQRQARLGPRHEAGREEVGHGKEIGKGARLL